MDGLTLFGLWRHGTANSAAIFPPSMTWTTAQRDCCAVHWYLRFTHGCQDHLDGHRRHRRNECRGLSRLWGQWPLVRGRRDRILSSCRRPCRLIVRAIPRNRRARSSGPAEVGRRAELLEGPSRRRSHPEFETRFESASIRERILVTRPKRSSVVLAAASFLRMPSSSAACNCCSWSFHCNRTARFCSAVSSLDSLNASGVAKTLAGLPIALSMSIATYDSALATLAGPALPRKNESSHCTPIVRRARSRNIERSNCAVLVAQEAVSHIIRVQIIPRDHPLGVDARRQGAQRRPGARAWDVDHRHRTVGIPHKAVIHVVGVYKKSNDRPLRVQTIDAANTGALERAGSRRWNVDHSDGTVRSAQEAMNHVVCVQVYSCNHPHWADI